MALNTGGMTWSPTGFDAPPPPRSFLGLGCGLFTSPPPPLGITAASHVCAPLTPPLPQAWTAYETKRHDKLRKAMAEQGLFTQKPDKAHTMAVMYASSFVPQNVKMTVVWELYWTRRSQANQAVRRYARKMDKLLDLRRKVDAYTRHRVGTREISGLTKLTCEIFLLAVQEPKFEFTFGGSVHYKELAQRAEAAMRHDCHASNSKPDLESPRDGAAPPDCPYALPPPLAPGMSWRPPDPTTPAPADPPPPTHGPSPALEAVQRRCSKRLLQSLSVATPGSHPYAPASPSGTPEPPPSYISSPSHRQPKRQTVSCRSPRGRSKPPASPSHSLRAPSEPTSPRAHPLCDPAPSAPAQGSPCTRSRPPASPRGHARPESHGPLHDPGHHRAAASRSPRGHREPRAFSAQRSPSPRPRPAPTPPFPEGGGEGPLSPTHTDLPPGVRQEPQVSHADGGPATAGVRDLPRLDRKRTDTAVTPGDTTRPGDSAAPGDDVRRARPLPGPAVPHRSRTVVNLSNSSTDGLDLHSSLPRSNTLDFLSRCKRGGQEGAGDDLELSTARDGAIFSVLGAPVGSVRPPHRSTSSASLVSEILAGPLAPGPAQLGTRLEQLLAPLPSAGGHPCARPTLVGPHSPGAPAHIPRHGRDSPGKPLKSLSPLSPCTTPSRQALPHPMSPSHAEASGQALRTGIMPCPLNDRKRT